MKKIVAVDLFCGAGGLTYGLEQAGIDVKLGVDIDGSCKHALEANTNAKFLEEDVKDLDAEVLKKAWGKGNIRLLAGCAPCQPFSSYSLGKLDRDDPRWSLLHAFARLIKQTLPELVTMENVGKLTEHKVFQEFLNSLEEMEYEYRWDVLDCRHYAIAQSRRRLVLVASRLGTPTLPKPTTKNPKKWKTVEDKIGNLYPIKAGEYLEEDPIHVAAQLNDLNMKRIKASKPGGTWKDWPEKLRTKCHRKDSGKTFSSVYGRMEWGKPSPTMTGQCFGYGNGRFGHPVQNRAISLREAAILQSFPPNYEFVPEGKSVSIKDVGLMIGNAVPPKLAEAIGKSLVKHVELFQ